MTPYEGRKKSNVSEFPKIMEDVLFPPGWRAVRKDHHNIIIEKKTTTDAMGKENWDVVDRLCNSTRQQPDDDMVELPRTVLYLLLSNTEFAAAQRRARRET